jgi:maleate isomerase
MTRLKFEHLPLKLDAGVAQRAAIGLIVLATDITLEHEWREMVRLPGVGTHTSRLYNDAAINPETLAAMERDIAGSTALLRPGERIDVVAFGCTSGAMVIGEEQVFARIREQRPGVVCTSPITAARAALEALGAKRIALLTPYVEAVNNWMCDYIEARGVRVPVFGSFNHEDDNEVARIDGASLSAAVEQLGAQDVDAVFVSCTSVRIAHLIAGLEAKLGKPVISSNQAMAWHALRLAGIGDALPGWGRLLSL